MESLKTAYRASVMIGTLIVGALAYRAYGPQLEKLTPFLSRAKQVVTETFSSDTESEKLSPQPPIEAMTPAAPQKFNATAQPLNAPALIDSQVQPVGVEALEPVPPAAAGAGRSPVAQVVDELKSRGITRYSFTPWGNNGELYRFHCAAPMVGDSGFTRHFEAVSTDPAEAAQQVLRQVNEWQLASGTEPQLR